MLKGMDLKNQFLENIHFEDVYYLFFIKIILMKIQGQKIYLVNLVNGNLLDIESICEDHPEITCRFLIEGNLEKENLEEKIKEALQNYPKLSGLDFKVQITRIIENNDKKTKSKSNEKIYFKLALKEVWLNVDLSLTELTESDQIIDKTKIKKENIIKINLDIKIKSPINEEKLNDILLNTIIEILGYRGENNNKEEDENKNEKEKSEENDDYYMFCNFKYDKNIDNPKNMNRMRSRSIKSKREINEDNNIIINNINNAENKNIKILNKTNQTKTRIEMRDMSENIKNLAAIMNKNNDNEKKNKSKETKESSKIIQEKNDLCFNINDKITCEVTYINFTNYIIKNENFTKDKDISYIKKLFNQNFEQFYETRKLDDRTKIIKEKKLIYLQFKEINDINNVLYKKKQETFFESKNKDELLEQLKKIDYNKKILIDLKPFIFKENFEREIKISENIRYNKSIFNEEIEPINDKVNERKSNLIVEEKLHNNFENNDNLQKKAILVIILIILIVIFVIKIS